MPSSRPPADLPSTPVPAATGKPIAGPAPRPAGKSADYATQAAQPVRFLKGVGPRFEPMLAKLDLHTVGDLWFHLPLRWEDRTRVTAIRDLRHGVDAQVEAEVQSGGVRFGARRQYVAELSDGTGTLRLRLLHFSASQVEAYTPGTRLRLYGTPRVGMYGAEFTHPKIQRVDPDAPAPVEETLTPVYPTTDGLSPEHLRKLIGLALALLPADAELDLLPTRLRRELALPSLREALLTVHRPPPEIDRKALLEGATAAQRRLAFEELLAHQLSMRLKRAAQRRQQAPRLGGDGGLRQRFLAELPFPLTGAQTRVSAEIAADLAEDAPMLRLVQGDVGAGKTVVAALAALAAIESGMQAALLAPTELLAEQHYRNFTRWLTPLGLPPVWLAGKLTGRAKARALADIAAGAPLAVGTHALITEAVAFPRLGLVIIDEQHRFGVGQRLALRDKGLSPDGGQVPHQLTLTATPIPRTLAMVDYADLDVSVLDELPPGRKPIQTVVVSSDRRDEVVARIRAACAAGRQAYWVCTLIEASEEIRAEDAEATAELLAAALPEVRVGLVHGRLKPKAKDAAMAAFAAGETQLLVATTVIEVGVDVPNASLMIIENPERLGLAQLHQLRGRVGRGSAQSSCVLLYQPPLGELARSRLGVLRESNDGFRIAEEDLRLRGPGELLGTRQTGHLGFRVADLSRHQDLLTPARSAADQLLREDPKRAEALVQRWIGASLRYSAA